MSKNKQTLEDFAKYCEANPEQRFWQALANWSGSQYVYVIDPVTGKMVDSWHREGK